MKVPYSTYYVNYIRHHKINNESLNYDINCQGIEKLINPKNLHFSKK